MSTRLQVVVPVAEMKAIRKLARAEGLTVSAWVRQLIRRARHEPRPKSREEILAVLAEAGKSDLPAVDIEQMLAESVPQYRDDLP